MFSGGDEDPRYFNEAGSCYRADAELQGILGTDLLRFTGLVFGPKAEELPF